jgi:type IV pilus assembly protein PilA
MLKRFIKNERGLTLIELLAVIVILGIIAAIAIPSIGGLINKTKEDAIKADAVQVLNAAKLYVSTNAGKVEDDIADATNHQVVLSKAKTDTSGPLDEYLDKAPEVYSVTITKSNNKFVYSNIEAGKNGIKFTFTTESDLDKSKGTKGTY